MFSSYKKKGNIECQCTTIGKLNTSLNEIIKNVIITYIVEVKNAYFHTY